jgi:hypothetical protein
MKMTMEFTAEEVKQALFEHAHARIGLPEGTTVEFPGDYAWGYSSHQMTLNIPEVRIEAAVAVALTPSQEDSDADL